MNTITINGEEFVKKSDVCLMAEPVDGMDYCIIRTYSAGVFAGYLAQRDGKEVTLRNARRIWYWEGACSLSQLAVDGTKNPENCKFAMPVPKIILTEVIEIIPTTEIAKKNIEGVEIWKK